MPSRKLMILAHPKSGTGYSAKYLSWLGVDVGHETRQSQGISCWSWAVSGAMKWQPHIRPQCPRTDGWTVVHLLRHPLDVMQSYRAIPEATRREMNRYVPIQTRETPSFEDAAVSWLTWNSMIEAIGCDYMLKIEDFEVYMPNVLRAIGVGFNKEPQGPPPPKNYNTYRDHYHRIGHDEVRQRLGRLSGPIALRMARYGYQ